MFKSVSHALNFAYSTAVRTPYSSPVTLLSTTRSEGMFNGWDEVAGQAGIIFNCLKQLSKHDVFLVEAAFIIPDGLDMAGRKIEALSELVEFIQKRIPKADINFITDIVYQWTGGEGYSNEYWSKELKVTERTIRMWRSGNMQRGKDGIETMLESDLNIAKSRLATILKGKKLL